MCGEWILSGQAWKQEKQSIRLSFIAVAQERDAGLNWGSSNGEPEEVVRHIRR